MPTDWHQARLNAWQGRARSLYFSNPAEVQRLAKLRAGERAYLGHLESEYRGFVLHANSFTVSYMDTIERAGHQAVPWSTPASAYWMLLLQHIVNFRRLRAAQNAFQAGYPISGFALLRDIKDQGYMLGAIAGGFVSICEANGILPAPPNTGTVEALRCEVDAFTERRRRVERRVFQWVKGANSPLSPDHRELLRDFDRTFDFEVHGSRMSTVPDMGFVLGETGLSFSPRPSEQVDSIFTNAWTAVAWLTHRTFPYLQRAQGSFGEDWAERWHFMDEMFNLSIEDSSRRGKPVWGAILALVDRRFAFMPETTVFREREAPEFYAPFRAAGSGS